MRLKLSKEIFFKNENNEEESLKYIYIQQPNMGNLLSNKNIGIFADLLHNVQNYLAIGYKKQNEINNNFEEKDNENEEETQVDSKDIDPLLQANALVYTCSLGGYLKIEEDLIFKGKKYFDSFLFLDEELKRNISYNNFVWQQLKDNGDILDLYKVMLSFFLQATQHSCQKKIEI